MTPRLDAATATDLEAIRAVLSSSALPIDDVAEHVAQFILAKHESRVIGTVAVEYAGQTALLRSLCVVPAYRGYGVGRRLLAAIEAQVVSRGVTELFLLTTRSAAFFEREGFARASRADAPSGIRGTAQFCTLCPATAVCMRKPLPARSNEVSTPP